MAGRRHTDQMARGAKCARTAEKRSTTRRSNPSHRCQAESSRFFEVSSCHFSIPKRSVTFCQLGIRATKPSCILKSGQGLRNQTWEPKRCAQRVIMVCNCLLGQTQIAPSPPKGHRTAVPRNKIHHAATRPARGYHSILRHHGHPRSANQTVNEASVWQRPCSAFRQHASLLRTP